MLERRVRDFRLDSRLIKYCQDDLMLLCGTMDELGGEERDVTTCLQDLVSDVKDDKCRALVKQYQQLAAQDIRFNSRLAEACHEDRSKHCANVPAVGWLRRRWSWVVAA